ncbi:uncharacterized protein MONOS_4329 [Monocercomonoides exilis]|uniref:uncharacterized protein n=1 Tax=Monocercomonoides exilis TaxID=2049356 RepID=UPI00355AA067|nr:hypothetical protein MONOS_4329 [Monocercomonoides exilis]|eukprot:MONOS_4329.1-p1 / transcript=MONOS_4329.1 / gene=MONOS_4329 / organism=Monocercomonoides_exilis_PA203 / gene_product=unspecified product / transcript_product=unspecified product / location=Mono_scaffold00113:118460-119146(-) / protein_length=229 / sequence_SO=supercontig / SO=protein_coding / is_pseudo=false
MKDWMKKEANDRYVGVSVEDTNKLCGISESSHFKTVGHAVASSMVQLSWTITVLGGRHVSEEVTINVRDKKIIITGRGKTVSVIGTNSLSSSSTTLFRVFSDQLEVGNVGIDHNAARSSSPSVFVVSVGIGTLSVEDVVIDSSTSGGSGISSSVFEVALRQLKTIDVEIENMKMSQPPFSEPSSGEAESDKSFQSNVTIRNLNLTGGNGTIVAKSAKERRYVWRATQQ